ncbi:MAG: hypothetical protein J7556_22125 [Acidovorax sp.]|nr:hypothetical protein [Acidovorax sp.]
MNVRPIHSLSQDEIRELATTAADNGEHHADANPFAPRCAGHAVFAAAHRERCEHLRRACAA